MGFVYVIGGDAVHLGPWVRVCMVYLLHAVAHDYAVVFNRENKSHIREVWKKTKDEPRREISINVVCATSKGSYQPAHMLGYPVDLRLRPNIIWSF